jgi:polyisoprenyl-teichoic acid--peptidoglycan teichoic acid transferase
MQRSKKLRRILSSIIVFLSLSLFGTGTYAAYLMVVKPIASSVDKIGATTTGKVKEEVTEVEVEAAKPISLLLLGVDNRPETGSLNSDIIMVATLNPDTKSATVVSLPRDAHMRPGKGLPSRKANYYYPYFHNKDKLTAFKNTRELYGNFFEVPIDAAVSVDFEGFRRMVDELGGIEVDVSQDMRYVDKADGTNINLRKGKQTLNGKQTLDYVRYRKSNMGTADSSDTERNKRQHEVINQMFDKVLSFGGVMKLNKLVEIAGDHVQTDIPSSKLMDFFTQYITINPSKIQFISLEGEWRSPYIELTEEEIELARQALKDTLEGKEPAPIVPETDQNTETETTVKPSTSPAPRR